MAANSEGRQLNTLILIWINEVCRPPYLIAIKSLFFICLDCRSASIHRKSKNYFHSPKLSILFAILPISTATFIRLSSSSVIRPTNNNNNGLEYVATAAAAAAVTTTFDCVVALTQKLCNQPRVMAWPRM